MEDINHLSAVKRKFSQEKQLQFSTNTSSHPFAAASYRLKNLIKSGEIKKKKTDFKVVDTHHYKILCYSMFFVFLYLGHFCVIKTKVFFVNESSLLASVSSTL